MNLEQIWSAFRKVEKAEDLGEWRVGDVYLWQVIRERLFTHIAEQTGLYLPVPEKPPIKAAKQASLQAAEIAIMPFVRRDAQGRDPFTDPFFKAAESAMLFGIGSEDEGSDKPLYEQLDAMLLAQYRTRAKLKVVFWQAKKHKQKWARVIKSLEGELSVNLDKYRKFPRWLLVDFVARQIGWTKLFKLAETQLLLIANAWQLWLVAGAKAAGVRVIEIQHGLISAYHSRLSWPDFKSDSPASGAYLADEFWQWGDFWGFASDLPAAVELHTIGAPENITAAIARDTKKKQQLLVIGQPQVSQSLIQFARFVAAKYAKLPVVLKPHPQEDLQQIEAAISAMGVRPANLTVTAVDANTIELIEESEYVIGVYSTAMFEAVALGCKVGVLKLAGYNHIAPLIHSGAIQEINRVSDVEKFFVSAKQNRNSESYFAKPTPARILLDAAMSRIEDQ
jgi:hypothetical protein